VSLIALAMGVRVCESRNDYNQLFIKKTPPHLQVNLPQGVSNQIVFTVHADCARATQRDKHVDTSCRVFHLSFMTMSQPTSFFSTMSQQTRVLSWTAHTNGDPLSVNDFSYLTNSLSPTPELQYPRDGTS